MPQNKLNRASPNFGPLLSPSLHTSPSSHPLDLDTLSSLLYHISPPLRVMSSSTSAASPAAVKYSKRKRVCHDGRLVYEWEQSLDEVLLVITPPSSLPARLLSVSIQPTHLSVGLKGNPAYLDEPLQRACVVSDSVWTLCDGELHIQLAKAEAGVAWTAATIGPHDADELSGGEATAERERLLLERMGREHAGFDFSHASVNGQVPDARYFMGGMSRSTAG